jgi:hypothetical protein
MNKSMPVDFKLVKNEARLSILPSEKQDNIIGRPAAVSFRKVFYGIVYVLECLKNWLNVNGR